MGMSKRTRMRFSPEDKAAAVKRHVRIQMPEEIAAFHSPVIEKDSRMTSLPWIATWRGSSSVSPGSFVQRSLMFLKVNSSRPQRMQTPINGVPFGLVRTIEWSLVGFFISSTVYPPLPPNLHLCAWVFAVEFYRHDLYLTVIPPENAVKGIF